MGNALPFDFIMTSSRRYPGQKAYDLLLDEYPALTYDETLSSHSLASKNVRALLKNSFPSLRFRVKTSFRSGASDMEISWPDFEDYPESREVSLLVQRFACRYHEEVRLSSSDVSKNRDFQRLFGSVDFLGTKLLPPTPAQIAARLEKKLPLAQTSLAPCRPRF